MTLPQAERRLSAILDLEATARTDRRATARPSQVCGGREPVSWREVAAELQSAAERAARARASPQL